VPELICELFEIFPEEAMVKYLIIKPYIWLEKSAKNPQVWIHQFIINPYLRRKAPFERGAACSFTDSQWEQ
jgi:hypothetical protein